MPTPLKRFLWLLAGFTTLGLGLITYAYTWGIIPYQPDIAEFDLNHDFSPEARAAMEPVILGGHFFIFDGQDIWMRFKAPEGGTAAAAELNSFIPDFAKSLPCEPTERATVRRWFLQRVSRPNLLAWFTPWSELNATDRLSLDTTGPIDCIYYAGLSASTLSTPNSCGRWWLHSQQTGFVYVRWACYN